MRGLPYLFTVKMCSVAGRWKVPHALKLKIVIYPKFSNSFGLAVKYKEETFNVLS